MWGHYYCDRGGTFGNSGFYTSSSCMTKILWRLPWEILFLSGVVKAYSGAGSTNWWNAVCLEFLSKKSSQEEIFWTWPWNHNQFWRTTILSTPWTVESWLYSEVRCRLFIYSSLCQSLWVRRRSNYWASLLCCLLAAMVMFTPLMKETQSSYDAIVRWKLQR